MSSSSWLFFFFQAEDGIRDGHVTGVQTCALPICAPERTPIAQARIGLPTGAMGVLSGALDDWRELREGSLTLRTIVRSEVRRVGEACRSRGAARRAKTKRSGDEEQRRSGSRENAI